MNRRDALVATLLATGLVVLLVPLARLGVDFHHDGIMLKPALDVLSGQVLFRDTFMQYGALTCYLQVVALWLHPSLLSVKLMTVAAYGVTMFFLYASWRLILPRSLAILACGLFFLFLPSYEQDWFGHYLIFLPWSSVFALMFQSVGLYALFRIIRGEQSEQWGLILGIVCACVFWCRQPVGLIMIGCVAVIWVALHWTNWGSGNYSKRAIFGRISGGFVAVNGIMLGGILLSGGLADWWYQNFVWPRKCAEDMYDNWSHFLDPHIHPVAGAGLLALLLAVFLPALVKKFRPTLLSRTITLYFLFLGGLLVWQHELVLNLLSLRQGGWASLLPLAILLQAIHSITQAVVDRESPKPTEYYLIAALSALSLGSALQYYPVPDPRHVSWSLAPSFGLLVFVFWRWSGWQPSILITVSVVLFLPALWVKAQLIAQALEQPTETLVRPAILRGMKLPPQQARVVGQITDILERISQYRPDMPSALIGNDAMILCLTTNHTNPSPYFVTWQKLADKEEDRKRWRFISSVRPMLFVNKIDRKLVDDYYRGMHYVPLLSLPEEELEIAVPDELAKIMNQTDSRAIP